MCLWSVVQRCVRIMSNFIESCVCMVPAQHRHWHLALKISQSLFLLLTFQRDKDISPVMYCASLIPGVWDRRWMDGQ